VSGELNIPAQKLLAFQMGPKQKVAIFSKAAVTLLIKFQ
jgi:hypothetical protein